MYAYLKGKITKIFPTEIILEVGNIGYDIKVPLTTSSAVQEGAEHKIYTYLHVKEDIHALFGFISEEDKKLFIKLISVSGVGPNTGLMFLSSLSSTEIINAILNSDVKTIQSVKGIGTKTASRVILDLKDVLKKEEVSGINHKNSFNSQNNIVKEEALAALITLGFPKQSAEKSVDFILSKNPEVNLEELIKLVLKNR